MNQQQYMDAKELVKFIENSKNMRYRILVAQFDCYADITKKELLVVLTHYMGPRASKSFDVDVDSAYGETICRIQPEL